MKTIIAGSRTLTDLSVVTSNLQNLDWEITEVVSGAASGADSLGEEWAKENLVPIKRFKAHWMRNGKVDRSAGIKRNIEMAEYAEALVAFWDGKSKGTEHMIMTAQKKRLKQIRIIYT